LGKYRGERWQLSYGIEAAYGAAPAAGLTATNLLGVFDSATLPDPSFDHQGYWLQNPSNRDYYIAYKGKAASSGSISNIILLDGRPLFLPIANTISHSAAPSPYTHTINETVNLPSIRLVVTNFSDEDTTPDELTRWFVGGKVGRTTYHCDEGGMLMMSLEDIQFKMPYFLDSETTSTLTPWYDTDAVKQTFSYPCSEPYYFSQGTIKMKVPVLGMAEVTIPSVRSFKLSVNNNLSPKYYIATNDEKVPYEIWEGRRQYSLALQIDLVDEDVSGFTKDTPFLELLNQGDNTTFKGASVELKFAKSDDDYITFTTPADGTPACGGNSQGDLITSAPMSIGTEGVTSVSMSMLCRNLKIEVKDAIAGTSYPA
jgi:hypothetical protein